MILILHVQNSIVPLGTFPDGVKNKLAARKRNITKA
jgi:hypothetical protein